MALIKLSPPKSEKPRVKIKLSKLNEYYQRSGGVVDTNQTLEYIPSYPSRVPMLTEWGEKGGISWDEADAMADLVQLRIPKGFVVLDFDVDDDAKIIQRIVEEKNIKCRMVKSIRGVHLYFRSNKSRWTNKQKQKLHIGLFCDWKVGNKNGLATVKRNGELYEVLRDIPVLETCELPAWLEITSDKAPNFRGMREGEGRNAAIFEHIARMECMGVPAEEALEACKIINHYIFAAPLDDKEFETATRDEAFKSKDDLAREMYFNDGKFMHNLLAVDLVEKHHIITRNGLPYIYDSKAGHYRLNDKDIENLVIDVFPSSKEINRVEVLKYITTLTTNSSRSYEPEGDERFTVNCKNGRLNLRTGQLSPHTPLAMDFQQIPVVYDPDAKCPELNNMLKKVLCNDPELGKLFEEIIGYSLMRTSEFDSFFILTGEGSNGKSTIIRLIGALVGASNSVSLSVQQLEERFMPASLEDKLVNIGDDIGSTSIRDTGILKKLASGEEIQVERKGKDSFVMKPICTMIYSANDIPHIADNSAGMKRRMVILPFDYTFSRKDKDFDPGIERKVITPQGLSALLNMAVRGAKRLIENGHFTQSKRANEALEAFYQSNSNVHAWAEDRGVDEEWLSDKTQPEVYKDYISYCREIGVRSPMSSRKFGSSMKRDLGARRGSLRRGEDVAKRWTLKVATS